MGRRGIKSVSIDNSSEIYCEWGAKNYMVVVGGESGSREGFQDGTNSRILYIDGNDPWVKRSVLSVRKGLLQIGESKIGSRNGRD